MTAVSFTYQGRGFDQLRLETFLPLAREEVFPFFANAENLERITPPGLGFSILTPVPIVMVEGCLIDYRLRLSGIPLRWRTEITGWDPPEGFTDRQIRGPYHTWVHRHTFEAVPGGTRIIDEVRFRLPAWPLTVPILPLIRGRLRSIFAYRSAAIRKRLLGEGHSDRSLLR